MSETKVSHDSKWLQAETVVLLYVVTIHCHVNQLRPREYCKMITTAPIAELQADLSINGRAVSGL